jgi:hypothetical protein
MHAWILLTYDNTLARPRRPQGDDSSFLSNAAQRNEAVVVIIMGCNYFNCYNIIKSYLYLQLIMFNLYIQFDMHR